MKFFPRLLLLVGLISCLLTQGMPSVSAAPTQKAVLVLFPDQIDLPANLLVAQAIQAEFNKAADLNLDIYYEYLDLNRFPNPVYKEQIISLLSAKYGNKQIDLVLTDGEMMTNLWLEQRGEILPSIPVVYFDINSSHINGQKFPADLTGVSAVEDFLPSIKWFLDIFPTVNDIVVVHGVGLSDLAYIQPVENLRESLGRKIQFTDLSALPLSEIKNRVANLPKSSVVLYEIMFEDAAGFKYRPMDVLRELTAVSPVPVISGFDHFIGSGTIGGYMFSVEHQAGQAAQLALRILRGASVSSIPQQNNHNGPFIFDHLVLQRFGIPLSALPPDSIIKNRQYTFWDTYQPQIIVTSLGILVLLVLIVFLLGLIRQLNRTRFALADLNVHLETQVQDRTVVLNRTNTQLQDEINERKQADEQLRESERRLTTLMSNLPGLAYRCRNDRNWTMDFVSEGCYDLSGYTAVDLIENRAIAYGQLIHPDDQTIVWDSVQAALETQTSYDMVYRIITRIGIEKWVMERGRGVFSEDGELLALEGFISDITQQKYTEQTFMVAHAESEIRAHERTEELFHLNEALNQYAINFEAVVNSASDGISIASDTGVLVFANGKFADIVGYSLAELSHTTMKDIAHPDEYPMLADRLRRRIAGESLPETYETAIRKKDGRKVPIELTASKILWQGQMADLVIVRDITERKRSEELIAIRLRLMEFAETHSLDEFLQNVLDEVSNLVNSPIGFFHYIDPDQITISLQAWSTRTQMEFCRADGEKLHYGIDSAGVWVDAVHQKRPVIHNDYAALLHKKGLPEGHADVVRELVVPILRENKVVAVLGVGNKSTQYTDQDVNLVAYFADMAWEITARKKIEQELLQYRDHLEQLVEMRTSELVMANERLAQEVQERKINLAKYTTLFEAFPLGITIAATDGKIIESNQEAERILSVSRGEQEQRTIDGSEWRIINPDGTLMLAEEYASVRALKEQRRIENIEMGIVKDGYPVTWINVTASPIPAEGLGVAVVYSDITERKRTEEKLRVSEEKFRSLLDSQTSNIMVFDFDGVHQYVNQVGLVSINDSAATQDIIGKSLHDLYPKNIADWQLEKIRQVFTTGKGFSGDFEIGDGEQSDQSKWWQLNLQPIRDALGQVSFVMVNSVDITENKRAETALKESELFVNGVLNSLTAQIAVLDEQGVIVIVNSAWKKFAESNNCPDPACYVGTNYLAVCESAVRAGDRSAEPMLEGMRAVLAGSKTQYVDEYPCDAPGIPRWFTVTVLPQSHPHKGLIVVHQNISARKFAEQALHKSEASLQAVLHSTADGILAVDSENKVLFVNGRFVEMWQVPEEVLASKEDAALLAHAFTQLANPQEFLDKVQELYQSDKESFEVVNFKDGRVYDRLSRPLIREQQTSGRVWSFRDVTDRNLAEMAMRESEARYRLLAENVSDVIWILDLETTHFTYVSPSIMGLRGFTPEEELNKSIHDVMTGESFQLFASELPIRLRAFANGVESERVRTDHIDQYRKDGSIVPTEVVTTLLTDAQGQVTQILGVSRDITERKRMEEELRESEKRTATILRLSPIVVGVSTVAEGCYTDVNDAFENVLGYSRDESIGHTAGDLNLWVDADTRSIILQKIQENGRVENFEIRLRRKSGEIFPALMFISPIMLRDKPCLLAMMMDITNRKLAEEQLRETSDTLQTIIYSSPLAILALDREDRVTIWNPAAEALFGWSDKQILGRANPTVPENKSREYVALREATMNGMAFSNLDTVRLKKDGTQFPVSLSVAPLRGQQSQVIGRMHIIADITERKMLQEELRLQATTDELTRVSNRRHFMQLAHSEIKRAIRLSRPVSVALMDIDHFKQINDTFGHAAGDQALIAFTKLCQKQIRDIDVFARFGGDEFVLLLPEANQEQAYEVVERVRLALMSHSINMVDRQVVLTMSSGITSLSSDKEIIDMLLSQADLALYHAKEAGRNNVVRYDLIDKE